MKMRNLDFTERLCIPEKPNHEVSLSSSKPPFNGLGLERHEILCLDPPLPPQADTMTYPVIKRGTAAEDIEFWLDPERKGWIEDDHRFMNDMIARGEDFPCFILNLNKENDLLTKT